MRFKLHYAWWTHLPAAACIAINLGLLLNTQLPERWGSPLDLWLSMLGWPLLILIGSAMLDEYYARHEQERRFAWASLVDELLIGLLVGRNMKMIPQLSNPEPVLSGWWPVALAFAGVAAALAVLLELRRPHLPSVDKAVDVTALAKNIQPQFQPGGRWMYWEKQNPIWWRCLIILVTIIACHGVVEAIQKSNWFVLGIIVPIAAFSVSCYGGFNVALTPGKFTVRLGRFGLPLLRLKLANVAKVAVVWFSALGDFGGWGFYRYSLSQHAWGLFISGGRGVIVQTKKGRRFLIGSKTPEQLAAATEAARIADTIPSQNTLRSDSNSALVQSGRSGGLRRGLIRAATGILVLLIIAIALHEPDSIKYTITSEGLTIHDLFYRVTIKSADIDIEHIKVVDIGVDPYWHPTEKINGTSSKRYKAGWFRVAGGEKIRLYRTTSQRLILLPPKGKSAPVLMEVKQPEAFIQEVRQAWR